MEAIYLKRIESQKGYCLSLDGQQCYFLSISEHAKDCVEVFTLFGYTCKDRVFVHCKEDEAEFTIGGLN